MGYSEIVMNRRRWALATQARHAVRFPHLWPTRELVRLTVEIRNSEKGGK